MKCPKCPEGDTKVIESRDVAAGQAIRRRRECLGCDYRFTTYERIERPNLIIVKKDGARQVYDRGKLIAGLQRASQKTSVSGPQIEELVGRIEEDLYARGENEVESNVIGEMAMHELAKLDDVAYVRFTSVYRSFKDIESFERELKMVKDRAGA